jgi:hypothetical protein
MKQPKPILHDLITLLNANQVAHRVLKTYRGTTVRIPQAAALPSCVYHWNVVAGSNASGEPELRFYSESDEARVYLEFSTAQKAFTYFKGKF